METPADFSAISYQKLTPSFRQTLDEMWFT
jgi:hypothetical protein